MIRSYTKMDKEACYQIFNQLDGWFGSEEINADYANQFSEENTLVAVMDGEVLGVISMEYHFGTTAEIYSMAVNLNHHRKSIGKALIEKAEVSAKSAGFEFLHVKTLGDELPHPGYKKTRAFYESFGFKRLFQTKDLWDGLPTMIYVKNIAT